MRPRPPGPRTRYISPPLHMHTSPGAERRHVYTLSRLRLPNMLVLALAALALSAATLTPRAHAQNSSTPSSESTNPPRCAVLSTETVCDAWKDSNFLMEYRDYFNYADEKDFNDFVRSRQPSFGKFVDFFKSKYACPNWNGQGLRYHVSFFCGTYAWLSQSACETKKPQLLCKSACEASRAAITAIFANDKFCTKDVDRTAILKVYDDLCSAAPTSDCVQHVEAESKDCGFSSAEAAAEYCKDEETKKADSCCANVSALAAGSESSTNLKLIIGLAIGGVAAILVAGFLIVFFLKRRQRSGTAGAKECEEVMEVIYNFVPNLDDELGLQVGDRVIVKVQYDDGWGYGVRIGGGNEEGVFPLACLKGLREDDPRDYDENLASGQFNKRASSMYGRA